MLLHNRYVAIKKIGKGGFGATFLAVDISQKETPWCVIKQLRPSTNEPSTFRMAMDLFEREAKTLGKVGDHPQIPALLDFFEENQQFYLLQEFVRGYNLQQEVKKKGVFNETAIKRFLTEMLPIIKYIHSRKVIHRDLKPANIIRRQDDNKLILIDFGAVKDEVNTVVAKTYGQTALTAFAVGTVGFAPPEQLAMRPIFASDIYALGVTCIYLLTGKSPKELGTDSTTGELLWEKEVNLSKGLTQILRTMVEVSVRHRYKNADEVLKAMDMLPYQDSLKDSMIMQTNVGEAEPQKTPLVDPSRFDLSNQPNASSKIAMAIRARKSRRNLGVGEPMPNSPSYAESGYSAYGGTESKNPVSPKEPSVRKVPLRLQEKNVIASYLKGRRDFSQQNLSGLNLQKANLSECLFRYSHLGKVNLQNADLSRTNFEGANLSQALLRRANLNKAMLNGSDLQNADCRGADFSFVIMDNAKLNGANFCGANLSNAKITQEQLALVKTNWATILPNGKRKLW
jgi:serine/threonine-protein kinase